MMLASDKRQCQHLSPENILSSSSKKAHSGEVALGILFALALVSSAVGWFFVYHLRRGKYGRVLQHDEGNSFLSESD